MFNKRQMLIIKRTLQLLKEGYSDLSEASKEAKRQLIEEGKIEED